MRRRIARRPASRSGVPCRHGYTSIPLRPIPAESARARAVRRRRADQSAGQHDRYADPPDRASRPSGRPRRACRRGLGSRRCQRGLAEPRDHAAAPAARRHRQRSARDPHRAAPGLSLGHGRNDGRIGRRRDTRGGCRRSRSAGRRADTASPGTSSSKRLALFSLAGLVLVAALVVLLRDRSSARVSRLRNRCRRWCCPRRSMRRPMRSGSGSD